MAELIIHDIDEELVRELESRAARNGVSVEEQHRRILRAALHPIVHQKSLKEHLQQMPDVGEDEDFERIRDYGRPLDLSI
jgi:antitoxin FitA